MLGGGVLYLDSFRTRMVDQRADELRVRVMVMAAALGEVDRREPGAMRPLAARFGALTQARLRVFAPDGRLAADSWDWTGPTYRLRDPETEPLRKHVARFLDRTLEWVAGAPPLPSFTEPPPGSGRSAWPEAERAARGTAASAARVAPDGTAVLSAAAALDRVARDGGAPLVLHATVNTRDITRVVRAERLTFFLTFLGVLGLTVLLSRFLARRIVRPLRKLALAAQRVRLGRAREVIVPRLPRRHDEIGELARAVSDMTLALRQRIDATEAFAADVAHELKNPLASMRSAVEALGRVEDASLRAQLLALLNDDLGRLNRLITNIADASRVDAELSRTSFGRVDLGALTAAFVAATDPLLPRGVRLAYARPEPGSALVDGDADRLGQVVRNLVDNAVSFSPGGGVVRIAVTAVQDEVVLRVDDEGPGIPPGSEETLFRRFYSERPTAESFGRHSGLGLAIVRTIVSAHQGTVTAENRMRGDGSVEGARFTVRLPANG